MCRYAVECREKFVESVGLHIIVSVVVCCGLRRKCFGLQWNVIESCGISSLFCIGSVAVCL